MNTSRSFARRSAATWPGGHREGRGGETNKAVRRAGRDRARLPLTPESLAPGHSTKRAAMLPHSVHSDCGLVDETLLQPSKFVDKTVVPSRARAYGSSCPKG